MERNVTALTFHFSPLTSHKISYLNPMLRPFWKIWWLLSGWKISGNFPQEIPKLLMIVGPHTSWKDVVVGFAARSILGIDHAHFLGKKELFDGPFGWLFRWLGGTPVDRFSSNGVVEQAADLFRKNERFLLAMSPEGTRKKVDRLRTGFYHIANPEFDLRHLGTND